MNIHYAFSIDLPPQDGERGCGWYRAGRKKIKEKIFRFKLLEASCGLFHHKLLKHITGIYTGDPFNTKK